MASTQEVIAGHGEVGSESKWGNSVGPEGDEERGRRGGRRGGLRTWERETLEHRDRRGQPGEQAGLGDKGFLSLDSRLWTGL